MPKQRFYDLNCENPLLEDHDSVEMEHKPGFLESDGKSSLGEFLGFESDDGIIANDKSEVSEERKDGERLRSLRSSSGSESRRRNYAQWLQDLRPELRQIKRTQIQRHNSFVADITPLEPAIESPSPQDLASFDANIEKPARQ